MRRQASWNLQSKWLRGVGGAALCCSLWNQRALADDSKSPPPRNSNAAARPAFRVHGMALGAKGLAPYQSREFGWGGGGIAALEWGPSATWGVQLELGLVGLGGSKKAPPTGVAELDAAAGGQLLAGLRVRPWATSAHKDSLGGLWMGAALGISLTGGSVAPALDAFLGHNFSLTERLSLGPALGYLLVMQTDKKSPRPQNAHLGFLGLNLSYDFGEPARSGSADRDHDGVPDERDACVEIPEDPDGFEDEDGCPESDNDRDGILDKQDRCPSDPEDRDEFEDDDGCSDPDNDVDHVLDVDDQCPLVAEDADAYQDEDGCPELDNDADHIPDTKDLCPNEAEVLNGIADNDGCPDSESVRVVGDKIELDQKIHFWTNSHIIRAMSYPVLDKLARFLLEHPEYVHVDVEGHADQRGDETFNLDLSRRRARSIAEFL
ncbi:MAG TPA: OmpA family protein, partial [Polyangiaceae bacterium]|nr:OmpA family protein [Polyangiaceae bacterium]